MAGESISNIIVGSNNAPEMQIETISNVVVNIENIEEMAQPERITNVVIGSEKVEGHNFFTYL